MLRNLSENVVSVVQTLQALQGFAMFGVQASSKRLGFQRGEGSLNFLFRKDWVAVKELNLSYYIWGNPINYYIPIMVA